MSSAPPKTPPCKRHSWKGKSTCSICGISRGDADRLAVLKNDKLKTLNKAQDASPKQPLPSDKVKPTTNLVKISEYLDATDKHPSKVTTYFSTEKAMEAKTKTSAVVMTYEEREEFDKLLQKKRKGGRPTAYDPRYHPQSLVEYFSREPYKIVIEPICAPGGMVVGEREVKVPNDPPFYIGWIMREGIGHDCFDRWSEKYDEFRGAKKICEHLFEQFCATNGMHGIAAGFITGLALKNKAKWKDKIDTEHKETKFLVHLNKFVNPIDGAEGEEAKIPEAKAEQGEAITVVGGKFEPPDQATSVPHSTTSP